VPDRPVTITPYRDGPLLVRGDVTIVGPDGEIIDPGRDVVALCRCGRSQLKPLCDGTHRIASFSAPSRPERDPRSR
jgi:CDGSH-type Zn-finger protein